MGITLSRKRPGPYGHELFAQPALSPRPPADGAPLALGQRRQHLSASLACRRAATLGTHLKASPHRHDVAFASLRQSGQEIGVVAIVGISHDTAMRYAPGACLIQERQGHLRL